MTVQRANRSLRRAAAFGRIALCAAGAAAAVALLGWLPTYELCGSAGVRAMLAAVGVALAGAWAGVLPTVACLSRPARQHPQGILTGLGVRFGVTVALALGLWSSGVLEERPFLLWVGIAQFAILGVDVWGLSVLLAQAAKEGP